MKSRFNPVSHMLAVGAFLSTAWVLSPAQTLQKLHTIPKYLLTSKKLVLLEAPQVVAGPIVLDAKWAPDGVHIAAIRRTERSVLENTVQEARLVLWSAGRQSHEIWHMDMMLDSLPHVAWISSNTFTVELKWHETTLKTDETGKVTGFDTPHQNVLWGDVAREHVTMLQELPGDHLYVSPTRPFAALLSPSQHQLTLLKPDGNSVKTLPLPEKTDWPRFHDDDLWLADGLHVCVNAQDLNASKPGEAFKTYAINVQTGEIKTEVPPTAPNPKVPASMVHLAQTEQVIKFGRRTQRLHPLWLESSDGGEQPQTLLASDSTGGKLASNGEAVLYVSDQAAWVTALHIGPKEPFVTNLRVTLRENAKQLGLAILMYAQDYDETFPMQDNSLQSAVEPYHKNNDLYEGFNYTFPGGSIGSVSSPATTELGTVDGPGGHYVIYVDGHVRWIPN